MAAIDHTALQAPITKSVTADGTAQQVQYPPGTRYVYFRIDSTSTVSQYKVQLPGATADLLDVTAGQWYGVAVFADKHTGRAGSTSAGTNSWLYVKADNLKTIDIEYSSIGGR